MQTVGVALGRVPRHAVLEQLDGMAGKALSPQPVVRAVLLTGADAAGDTVSNALVTLSDTLSCDALNEGVNDITDTVCCDVSYVRAHTPPHIHAQLPARNFISLTAA